MPVEKCIRILRDHQHFVQGVAWDPLGKFLVTESCDRSVKIWQTSTKRSGTLQILPVNKLSKSITGQHLFHDEALVSFFRRPSFSPDGALLFLPAGVDRNCFYIQSRSQISGMPVALIGGFSHPVLGVCVNPRLFQSIDGQSLFKRPYVIVYAVFTMDTVAVFDTRQKMPIATCKDLHYGSLTDASWAPDGYSLIVTSTDGFCSVISFTMEELGPTISEAEQSDIITNLSGGVTPQPDGIPQESSDPMDIEIVPIEVYSTMQEKSLPIKECITLDKGQGALPSEEVTVTEKRRIQPTLVSSSYLN